MKAITEPQPWASLIAAGVKTILTRSWSSEYRGPLAIHAGKHRPAHDEAVGDWYWDEVHYDGQIVYRYGPQVRPGGLGAVVATCTLADVVPMVDSLTGSVPVDPHVLIGDRHEPPLAFRELDSRLPADGNGGVPFRSDDLTGQLPFGDFTPGWYAWLLTDITPCDPVPAKGRRGLWDWDGTP